MLTLPELNNALKREDPVDIDAAGNITMYDKTGIYTLSTLKEKLGDNYEYEGEKYWYLASPSDRDHDDEQDRDGTCLRNVSTNGNIGSSVGYPWGIRVVIDVSVNIKLTRKTDDTGFVYYEMTITN